MLNTSANTVSVIIPCYNQSHFLKQAIESVIGQTYTNYEIILVDDGSTDNTKEIALQYPQVKYIYQKNKGLSAARNTGIKNSNGEYLVFLDSDDWLYPQALYTNVGYLQTNPDVAFVSGAHDKIFIDSGKVTEVKHYKSGDYFTHLLHHNFIGMIAAVMFRRWVFAEFEFDTTLKACEDYDLYLNVAKQFPLLHHTNKISAYRIHSNSMSADPLYMLNTVLMVKKRYVSSIKTKSQMIKFEKGNKFYKDFYYNELYLKVNSNKYNLGFKQFQLILLNKPHYILRFIKDKIVSIFQLK